MPLSTYIENIRRVLLLLRDAESGIGDLFCSLLLNPADPFLTQELELSSTSARQHQLCQWLHRRLSRLWRSPLYERQGSRRD